MASLCGRLTKQMNEISSESEFELGEARQFSFRSLQDATNKFSNPNLIGFGGFAKIYRGVLPNGTLIAVEKYHPETMKYLQFGTTLQVFSCIRHPNIIGLIGYCVYKNQFLLVREYMSNGSLNNLLRNKEKRESVFNWPMRVAVCNGIARGLRHLHEEINPRAIHRNIKSTKVLFDSNFTPKITGFGLVKVVQEEEEDDLVVGTVGYLDPEYYATGKCTTKSDVYGFGVVMLEIISGRKVFFQSENSDNGREYLRTWALDLLAKDRVLEVVDPVLADFPVDQVLGFIDVALSCVEEESRLRPSMGEVIQKLNRMCDSPLAPFEMQQPNTPYFSAASSFRSSTEQTFDEIEEESSTEKGESSGEPKERTNLQAQEEVKEAAETSATNSNAMVFERPTVRQGEYAAYWRKKNMMPRNKA